MTEASSKSNEFDKLTLENALTSKAILPSSDATKIFSTVPYHDVKFNRKHDRNVAEPVRLTIVLLCPNFQQKCGPEQQKIVLPQF